jgi:hypothetical protein
MATINKVNGNSLWFQQIRSMFRDRQLIFKNDIAVERQFTSKPQRPHC